MAHASAVGTRVVMGARMGRGEARHVTGGRTGQSTLSLSHSFEPGRVFYRDSLGLSRHESPASLHPARWPLRCRRLLLGQRSEPEVWLDDAELREQCLGLVVLDAGVNWRAPVSANWSPAKLPWPIHTDNVVARNPVDRCCDPVLISRLQRVEHAQHLRRVAPRGRGVGEYEANRLLGVDDEDAADGEGNALCVDIRLVLLVNHVVEIGNFAALVSDNGEFQLAARDLVDVLDPSSMTLNRVGRKANEFRAPLGELGLELRESTELRGADGCVVFWVGEQDDPFVANELYSPVSFTRHAPLYQNADRDGPWKSMLPWVVSAWKLGAMLPSRRGSARRSAILRSV